MAILRGLIGLIGVLSALMGLLWVGQGLGVIMWPPDSFMLADQQWAVYGASLSVFGLALIWLSLLLRR
jgi:hypothetical protein